MYISFIAFISLILYISYLNIFCSNNLILPDSIESNIIWILGGIINLGILFEFFGLIYNYFKEDDTRKNK